MPCFIRPAILKEVNFNIYLKLISVFKDKFLSGNNDINIFTISEAQKIRMTYHELRDLSFEIEECLSLLGAWYVSIIPKEVPIFYK